MIKRTVAVLVLVLGTLGFGAGSAGATECTPKGCTGGCRVGDVSIDIDTLTVTGEPFECYS